MSKILVVDDDPDVLTAVRLLLKTEVKEVVTEKNPENLKWHLNKDHFDLILLDMNFTSSIHTGNEGLFWLNEIKKIKNGFRCDHDHRLWRHRPGRTIIKRGGC